MRTSLRSESSGERRLPRHSAAKADRAHRRQEFRATTRQANTIFPQFTRFLPATSAACYCYGTMQVKVEMPDEIARQWGETPDAVGRRVMEDAAIEGYRAGRLSHRQVGQVLGLDYWQTEAFLKERGVPVNYSAADLDADNATLDKILVQS